MKGPRNWNGCKSWVSVCGLSLNLPLCIDSCTTYSTDLPLIIPVQKCLYVLEMAIRLRFWSEIDPLQGSNIPHGPSIQRT